MLSIFNISLPTANIIYTLSNLILVLGALLVLVGTVGAVFSGGIREHFADERISRNEAETATANARAAEADQRAAEARLRLAQITVPRRLTTEQTEKLKPLLAAIAHKGKVVVKGRWPDEEALSFAKQISELMSETGFDVIETPTAQHLLSMGNVGVNIIVRDAANPPPAAAPVYEAFKQVGLEMPGISNPVQVPETDIFWILVGSRY